MRKLVVGMIAVLLAVLIVGCTPGQQRAGMELMLSLNPTQQVLLATVAPAFLTPSAVVSSESVVATNTPVSVASAPVAMSSATATSQGQRAVVTTVQDTKQRGKWEIQYYTGATQLMRDFVFTDPDKTWAEFPNVDWPKGGFLAKNGLEYGQELSSYCQQDERCDVVVAARSFRSVTGDYEVDGIGNCEEGGTGIGCALLLFNVGDVSAMLRDQSVDTGHTVTGLYWNGDELDQAVSALASHISYRMIGIPSGNPANPGANCSVPTGCKGVDLVFAILSGNELLVRGHALVD